MTRNMVLLSVLCAAIAIGEEIYEGSPVVVTASPPERNLMDTPAAESPSLDIATSTVDAAMIEAQNAATLTEALDFAPGIHTEMRGRKYKNFTSFRGQIYPYPTYSINGIWQREFSELAYVLPASQIQEVGIQRSSGTLFSGLGDITGVINIEPRRYDRRTTVVYGEAGTFDTWRAGAAHGNTDENGWYNAGADYFETAGPSGRNAAEQRYGAYGFGGLQASDRMYLEGQLFVLEGSREIMTPDPDGPALDSLKNRLEEYDPFDTLHAGGKLLFKQTPSASLELSAGYTDRNYHHVRTGGTTVETDEDDYEYTVQAIQALELNDVNTLRFGGVYNHWVAPEGKRSYTGFRQDVQSFAVVLGDEHQLDKLTIDAGLRVTQDYYNEFSGATFNINGRSRDFKTVKDEWGDPLVTAALGAKYLVSEPLSLYAHIAGGERAAEPGALKADNSNLDDELRMMSDAGARIQNPDFGTLKAGAFYVLRKDAITKTDESGIDEDGDTFYFSDNQDVMQYGLELEARSVPIAGIATLFCGAALMESRLTPAGESSSRDYVEIPDLILTGGLMADSGRWDAALFCKYVSSYENNRFVQPPAPGRPAPYVDLGDYAEVNATVGYTLSRPDARIYVAASNLLDDEYSTVAGWSDPGFEVRGGARVEF